VYEARQDLMNEIGERSIDWSVADLPAVSGDRSMLQIVVSSLLSNALKFTRPRAQTRIEIGCSENSDAEVVLFIRDNGVGFDMKYAGKLFGVFQRLHRPTEFEGNGIGLALVRRIIGRHGGRAWAESSPDQGATFYFSLPRV
jgi:light-regulated signal transduction histidine kinase (bacteriophytochrome)